MNKNIIKPIIFSVICLLLFSVVLTSSFLYIGAHLQKDPSTQSTPPTVSVTPSYDSAESSKPESIENTESVHISSEVSPSGNLGGDENPTPWILVESEDGGISYQDSLTLLGDSTT